MKLIVFISNEDNFYGSAKKIKDLCDIDCEIIYIESFIEEKGWEKITNSDIVYFLCNGEKVNFVFKNIIKVNSNCKIINKEYLLKNDSKAIVQQKINKIGVPTPKLLSYDNIDTIKFPIFCKQNTHTGIVFKAYTKRTITDFFQKFNVNNFYLEEDVTSDLESHIEFKAYFANGKTYPKDTENNFDKQIDNICIKIAHALYNLESFSVDFIQNNNGLYVIDVNIASGFYMSTGARKEFVKKYVNKK